MQVVYANTLSLPPQRKCKFHEFPCFNERATTRVHLKALLPKFLFRENMDAIERVAYELCEDQSRAGVVYFEVRYCPHLFLEDENIENKNNFYGTPGLLHRVRIYFIIFFPHISSEFSHGEDARCDSGGELWFEYGKRGLWSEFPSHPCLHPRKAKSV